VTDELKLKLQAVRENRAGHPHDGGLTIDRDVLDEVIETIDWLEKGNDEWRDAATRNARHAEAARATARVAIGHLQAVLRNPLSEECVKARDWLISIGSDPT